MAQNTVRKENARGYMAGRLYVSKFRGGRFMETPYDTVLEFLNPMGARNRIGTGLSYWSARLQRLAELIPWNRFIGSLKV
jgi:hypothetical protein